MTRTPENQSRPSFVDTRPLLRLATDFVRPYSRLAGLILFLITFAVNWLAARLVGVTGARRRGGQL